MKGAILYYNINTLDLYMTKTRASNFIEQILPEVKSQINTSATTVASMFYPHQQTSPSNKN